MDRMESIKRITQHEGLAMIDRHLKGEENPTGLFWYKEVFSYIDPLYIGIDNSTGHCNVEDFTQLSECITWLRWEDME